MTAAALVWVAEASLGGAGGETALAWAEVTGAAGVSIAGLTVVAGTMNEVLVGETTVAWAVVYGR